MVNYVDLHTHSTASDGIYSPSDLLKHAHEAGLRVLALTDHDSTSGLDEASEAALHLAIDLIPGIEINTDVGKDEIHVLGYYLEYQRPEFQAILQVLRDARVRRGQRMVETPQSTGSSHHMGTCSANRTGISWSPPCCQGSARGRICPINGRSL